ncbi:MAG: hypothetical protein QOH04_2966 [Sphingomonadales bacterium]|jgi:hypothetical protein|nr:hypothetical protein [Sphingomonadales bacterium]
MTRAAAEVMQDVLYAAVVDAILALKAASRGVPNTLLRDLNAIHANTTFADLPPELQKALQAGVRAAFTRLLKEGYSVSPAGSAPPRPASPPRREGGHGQRPGGPGGHRGPRPGGGQPPRAPRTGPGGGPRPGGGRGPRPKG